MFPLKNSTGIAEAYLSLERWTL